MPAPKYTVRRRYFTERDPHGDPLPDERLLYLELLEIDEEAGVARFAYELAAPDVELWLATVDGWESRSDVRQSVQKEAVGAWIEGGTIAIPLTIGPKVTQAEIRRADLSTVVLYRITTQGADERTFRYRTETDTSEAAAASRWSIRIEETRARFRITNEGGRPVLDDAAAADAYLAVHENGRPVFDSGAAQASYTPAEEPDAPVRLVDDYDDDESGFVRPIAYTEVLADADEPFDDGGRPAYERGAAPGVWRHAQTSVIGGAGLVIYRSESHG